MFSRSQKARPILRPEFMLVWIQSMASIAETHRLFLPDEPYILYSSHGQAPSDSAGMSVFMEAPASLSTRLIHDWLRGQRVAPSD
jgi:hypothetical protein